MCGKCGPKPTKCKTCGKEYPRATFAKACEIRHRPRPNIEEIVQAPGHEGPHGVKF